MRLIDTYNLNSLTEALNSTSATISDTAKNFTLTTSAISDLLSSYKPFEDKYTIEEEEVPDRYIREWMGNPYLTLGWLKAFESIKSIINHSMEDPELEVVDNEKLDAFLEEFKIVNP